MGHNWAFAYRNWPQSHRKLQLICPGSSVAQTCTTQYRLYWVSYNPWYTPTYDEKETHRLTLSNLWPLYGTHDHFYKVITYVIWNINSQISMMPSTVPHMPMITTQIAKFMGPSWCPPGSWRPQVGPMLATWILLSEYSITFRAIAYYYYCKNANVDNSIQHL